MFQPRPPRPRMPFNNSYRMQNFQHNPNFVPRGRGRGGPRYGHHPKYRGPSPLQNGSEDHWCETCDRGFPSQDELENHKQQHQKCNIDGCQFIAHPKVITKHIQMQHSTGLFQKIANLNNPEDIQKWREERKRRFPTKENIEKKVAEIKEKIERGEKMGLKKNKNFNNGENQKRKHPNNNADDVKRKRFENQDTTYSSNSKKRNRKPKKDIPLPPPENIRKLKPFAGIQDLVLHNDDEIKVEDDDSDLDDQIEDDDDCLAPIKEVDTNSKIEEPTVCGALSSLMCEYGSSDEENETQDLKNESIAGDKNIPVAKNEDGKINKPKNAIETPGINESMESNINNIDMKLGIQNNIPVVETKHESDDDAPEEIKFEKPVALTDDGKDKDNKSQTKSDTKRTKNKNDFQNKNNNKKKLNRNNFKPKVPSTLLQKLLHREIQQERNIVLQCIRHIVKNNYFDK